MGAEKRRWWGRLIWKRRGPLAQRKTSSSTLRYKRPEEEREDINRKAIEEDVKENKNRAWKNEKTAQCL